MNKENCALNLVNEIILYYDARSKKHQNAHCVCSLTESTNNYHAVHVSNNRLSPYAGRIFSGPFSRRKTSIS